MIYRSDYLLDFTLQVAEQVLRHGGEVIFENPLGRRLKVCPAAAFQPDHWCIWDEPAMIAFAERAGAKLLHVPQCEYGGAFEKWTTLLCSAQAAANLRELNGIMGCRGATLSV